MKTNFKSMALAALVLLGLGACSNELDEQFQQTEGQELTFNLSINGLTRTVTDDNRATTFVNGDAVGLFAFEKGTQSLAYTNVKLTYNGSAWIADSKVFSDKAYDFYAYYPYNANVTDPKAIAVSAQADQTSGYNLSDVLASTKSEVAAEATEVPLTFNHVFSMVEVQVSGDLVTVKPTGDITLDNVQTTAALDLTTGKATANGNKASVKAFYLGVKGGVHAYRAIIPSQTVATGTQLLTVNGVNDKSYAMKHPSDVVYTAGKYRQLKMNIGKDKVELTIPTPTINPWEPDTEIPGQGEEVTPPAPDPETLVTDFGLAEGTQFTAKGKFATNNLVAEGAGWFTRFGDDTGETKAEAVTSTFTNVGSATHAVKLTLGANAANAWNGNSVCYRINKPFEQDKYKITFVAKPTAGGASASVSGGVMIRIAGDDKLFTIPFMDGKVQKEKGIHTFTINAEKEIIATFDFGRKTEKASSGAITTPADIVKSAADDVKAINIYFYNNTKGSSLEIVPLKLEKIAAQ